MENLNRRYLFFKSGGRTKVFFNRGKLKPNENERGGLINFFYDMLKLNAPQDSEQYAFFGIDSDSADFIKYNIKTLNTFDDIVSYKPTHIIIDLGVENREFDKPIVDYINSKTPSELKLFMFSLNPNYIKLAGLKRNYRVFTNLDRFIDYLEKDFLNFCPLYNNWKLFNDRWHLKTLARQNTAQDKPILIYNNQIQTIKKIAKSLPNLKFNVLARISQETLDKLAQEVENINLVFEDSYYRNEKEHFLSQYDIVLTTKKETNYFEESYKSFLEFEFFENLLQHIYFKDDKETLDLIQDVYKKSKNDLELNSDCWDSLYLKLLYNYMYKARLLKEPIEKLTNYLRMQV